MRIVEPGEPPSEARWLRVRFRRIDALDVLDVLDATGVGGEAGPVAETLAGHYVLPGLVDLHVHYPPRVALGQERLWSLLFLAHGVTTVRELGSIDGSVFDVAHAIRAGEFPGPRLLACGEVLDGAPPSFPSNRVVTTPEQARQAVADQHARGARCIKVYNSLGSSELETVKDEAARRGLPVVGHKPHAVALEDAGVSELQHGTGIPLVDRERVGLEDFRFEDWAGMDDSRLDRAVALHRELGIAQTLTLFNSRVRPCLVDPAPCAADSGVRHLPRYWQGVWATLWSPPWSRGDAEAEAVFAVFRERQREAGRKLIEAGVEVRVGTDTLMPWVAPGSSLHGELEELARLGLGREGALSAATAGAGRALGVRGLGQVAVGAPADLLFYRRDPRADPETLMRPDAVLADGRLYSRQDLDAALARSDAHFRGAFYETAMGAVVASVRRLYAPPRPPGPSDPGARE